MLTRWIIVSNDLAEASCATKISEPWLKQGKSILEEVAKVVSENSVAETISNGCWYCCKDLEWIDLLVCWKPQPRLLELKKLAVLFCHRAWQHADEKYCHHHRRGLHFACALTVLRLPRNWSWGFKSQSMLLCLVDTLPEILIFPFPSPHVHHSSSQRNRLCWLSPPGSTFLMGPAVVRDPFRFHRLYAQRKRFVPLR